MTEKQNRKKILEVKNLTIEFRTDSGIIHAVNDVTYDLHEGEILGVVGESGCGKSVHAMSMLQLISCPPGKITNGQALYDGRDLLKMNFKDMQKIRGNEIAMIFQDPITSLNPVLKVGVQITETLIAHLHITKREAKERALDLLHMVGIPNPQTRLNQYPHEFSGGMRQRVMIAMGISCNPKILIADEPTTALDVTVQAQIVELIQKLNRELGMAVMWITHDLGVVAEIADTVNVMYGGRVIERGSAYQVFKNPTHPYTKGLLAAIPRDPGSKKQKLVSIPGQPVVLIGDIKGCPFYERCDYRLPECSEKEMVLDKGVEEGHLTTCFRWEEIRGAQNGKL